MHALTKNLIMDRRYFLKNIIPPAVLIPSMFRGVSIHSLAASSPLIQGLMFPSPETDHVLVLIQLSGGNDGLNTVIPIEYFPEYVNARSNIYIPQDKALKLNGITKIALNPAMTGLQNLYNDGKLNIIQSVGYPQPSFSHFRATDIWMTGSDSGQVLETGWNGRYLSYEYPNFPDGYPNASVPDPLGIRIGSTSTLNFQGQSINMGMSITNPTSFYNFLDGVQDTAPATPAGKELSFVRTIGQQTQQYAKVLKTAAGNVTQQSAYPANNSLGDQLKIVARLIKGGLKTKIYLVSYGSFDTHSKQVNATDTTTGTHASLLQTLSDAIKAFQDDCKFLGIEDQVLGMTFSEFGRRIKSNASGGTDHGSAAPMFIFGKNAIPGVLGDTPAIPTNVSVNDNIPFQYDFRSVYYSLLANWLCVDNAGLQQSIPGNFQELAIVKADACHPTTPNLSGESLISNSPNPFSSFTTITFKSMGGHVSIQVIDSTGRVIKTLADAEYVAGTFSIPFYAQDLPNGIYYARFQNMSRQHVRTMSKVR